MRKLVSVDTETTGLDPELQEAWEVGIVTENGYEESAQFPLLRPEHANEKALEIGRFHERHKPLDASLALDAAARIATLLDGATLLGANPQFDAAFLTRLLRDYGYEPTWHHRMLDLGSYVAGVLGEDRPLGTEGIATLYVPNDEAHTALGDARWNLEVFNRARVHAL